MENGRQMMIKSKSMDSFLCFNDIRVGGMWWMCLVACTRQRIHGCSQTNIDAICRITRVQFCGKKLHASMDEMTHCTSGLKHSRHVFIILIVHDRTRRIQQSVTTPQSLNSSSIFSNAGRVVYLFHKQNKFLRRDNNIDCIF